MDKINVSPYRYILTSFTKDLTNYTFFFLAEISVVICENDVKCNMLLDRAPRLLKKIILIKEASPATKQRAKNRGIEVYRFDQIEKLGASKNVPEVVR